MEAAQLKEVDMDYRNHLQAFLNFVVKAEKKVGKRKSRPVYDRFEKFYDYEREQKKVLNKGEHKGRFSSVVRAIKKQRGGG